MHELAIAQSILEHIENAVQPNEIPYVTKIVVRIGSLTDVVPDALSFNFDVIKMDTPLAKAELVIEEQAVTAHCLTCGCDFKVEAYFFVCPKCSSGQVEVTAGEELDIVYVEIEDETVRECEHGKKTNTT